MPTRSPLRCASFWRVLKYTVLNALTHRASGNIAAAQPAEPAAWADAWRDRVRAEFLTVYRETVGQADFMPKGAGTFERVLAVFELEKALYELDYEMNNRPDWLWVPLQGIVRIRGRSS